MSHVKLHTPVSQHLSSGIVCIEIDGLSPFAAVTRLHERGIIATVTPYAERYVRFAPSMRNLPEEIETVLREVHQLR
jgi:isopenicillin-N epimerase